MPRFTIEIDDETNSKLDSISSETGVSKQRIMLIAYRNWVKVGAAANFYEAATSKSFPEHLKETS